MTEKELKVQNQKASILQRKKTMLLSSFVNMKVKDFVYLLFTLKNSREVKNILTFSIAYNDLLDEEIKDKFHLLADIFSSLCPLSHDKNENMPFAEQVAQ